jgi:hypothetical protein
MWTRRALTLPAHSDSQGRPCVVHLVRRANGLRSLREFVAAFRRYEAGTEYELVLAMKGFRSRSEAEPYLAEAADLRPEILSFPDVGFDVGVFLATAARLRRTRYCFLNSHVRPACDGWLAMLDSALQRPDVGLVGPFGSWASFHSWLTYSMGLPSAYRGVLPPPSLVRALLREMELEQREGERRSALASLRTRLRLLLQVPEELLDFEPFPAHHMRTSAFMIAHAVLAEMPLFVVRSKMDAYALESGSHGFTRQAERMGLRALVVDRAGVTHEHPAWDRSQTFCQGGQERLLMVDNRTLLYERGDPARRRLLAALAWGTPVDPPVTPVGVSVPVDPCRP